MKFVFIDPKGLTSGLNTGLGYLSAVLLKAGHDVKVIDFNNKQGNENSRLSNCKDADFVGISIKSFTLDTSLQLIKKIRQISSAKIIVGGPHITLDGMNFIKENDVDVCVLGEGEETIKEIAEKNLREIKGIIYREGEKILTTGMREWITDIDKIPFPDYSVFDSIKNIKDYPIVTSRGCPYNCTYCSVCNVIGRKWRARSPENIIEELKEAKRKYNIKEFKVLDDNFTLDLERVKKFCDLLIKENLNLKWSCPNGIRADRLDMEMLLKMKQSGCYSISLGIESLDEDVFDSINKGEKLDDIINAIKMIKKAGIEVNGFFIIGLPGSTYEKDKETMKKIKGLGLKYASWGILVPYPGTKVWEWLQSEIKNGNAKMLSDWKKGFHIGFRPKPVFETKIYPAKKMIRAYYIANIKFLGWKIIPYALKIFFKSLK